LLLFVRGPERKTPYRVILNFLVNRYPFLASLNPKRIPRTPCARFYPFHELTAFEAPGKAVNNNHSNYYSPLL
jgi:hypothetical protein